MNGFHIYLVRKYAPVRLNMCKVVNMAWFYGVLVFSFYSMISVIRRSEHVTICLW